MHVWVLPPDDTLGQPGERSCQFVSNVLREVLDSSSERHDHKAVLCGVFHPQLKILQEEEKAQ